MQPPCIHSLMLPDTFSIQPQACSCPPPPPATVHERADKQSARTLSVALHEQLLLQQAHPLLVHLQQGQWAQTSDHIWPGRACPAHLKNTLPRKAARLCSRLCSLNPNPNPQYVPQRYSQGLRTTKSWTGLVGDAKKREVGKACGGCIDGTMGQLQPCVKQ